MTSWSFQRGGSLNLPKPDNSYVPTCYQHPRTLQYTYPLPNETSTNLKSLLAAGMYIAMFLDAEKCWY